MYVIFYKKGEECFIGRSRGAHFYERLFFLKDDTVAGLELKIDELIAQTAESCKIVAENGEHGLDEDLPVISFVTPILYSPTEMSAEADKLLRNEVEGYNAQFTTALDAVKSGYIEERQEDVDAEHTQED